jgi:lipoate-protein ligase A
VRSRVANLKDYLPNISGIEEFKDRLFEIMSRNSEGGQDEELPLRNEQRAQVEVFAKEKFRTWEWIYGRSPKADFRSSKKFQCGTVEVSFSVNHGIITGLRFGGDYLGNLPTSSLEENLEGVRMSAEDILQALESGTPAGEYFDGMKNEDILSLIMGDNHENQNTNTI